MKQRGFAPVLLLLIVAILIGVVAIGSHLMQWQRQKSADVVKLQYCSLRLEKMICFDIKGQNIMRYDLPKINGGNIRHLAPSPDGKQFLAVLDDDSIVILNEKLELVKKLVFDKKFSASTPTWSTGGKSILLEIDQSDGTSHGFTRDIYRYELVTDKLTKLSTIGSNMLPYETKNGQIIYQFFNPPVIHTWLPYIMNNDGTNPRALPQLDQNDKKNLMTVSYDQRTDTLFLLEGDILKYGLFSDLINGSPLKSIKADVGSSASAVVAFDSETILIPSIYGKGHTDIINLLNGQIIATVSGTSNPVGVLSDTSLFTPSQQQVEQKYDRLLGLNGVPADFSTFIKSEFNNMDTACAGGSIPSEAFFTVGKVIRDQFAAVGQGCENMPGSAGVFYVKQNGQWIYAFALQNTPSCDTLNKWAIPKDLVSECYDPNSKNTIENNNP